MNYYFLKSVISILGGHCDYLHSVQKEPSMNYETRQFITAFTSARHLSLSKYITNKYTGTPHHQHITFFCSRISVAALETRAFSALVMSVEHSNDYALHFSMEIKNE
jgi:hypothetical protein